MEKVVVGMNNTLGDLISRTKEINSIEASKKNWKASYEAKSREVNEQIV